MKKILEYFTESRFWHWVSRHIVGKLTFRIMGYIDIDFQDFFTMHRLMDSDDFYVFTSSDTKSLASIAIKWVVPGETRYTHAGIIIPSEDPSRCRAVHMNADGLRIEHLLNVMKECDRIALIKISLTTAKKKKAIERLDFYMNNKESLEYDFSQKLDNPNDDVIDWKVYCSELLYLVLNDLVDDEDFAVSEVAGRAAFTPDSVFKSGEVLFETGV